MKEKVTLASKRKDANEIKPVKGGPTVDNDGGILTAKIAAIIKKIKNKLKRS